VTLQQRVIAAAHAVRVFVDDDARLAMIGVALALIVIVWASGISWRRRRHR